jgi:hypothetical protein
MSTQTTYGQQASPEQQSAAPVCCLCRPCNRSPASSRWFEGKKYFIVVRTPDGISQDAMAALNRFAHNYKDCASVIQHRRAHSRQSVSD